MEGKLVQVIAPHFCAGIILNDANVVTYAAPILKWTIGKHTSYLKDYFKHKRWTTVYLGTN